METHFYHCTLVDTVLLVGKEEYFLLVTKEKHRSTILDSKQHLNLEIATVLCKHFTNIPLILQKTGMEAQLPGCCQFSKLACDLDRR